MFVSAPSERGKQIDLAVVRCARSPPTNWLDGAARANLGPIDSLLLFARRRRRSIIRPPTGRRRPLRSSAASRKVGASSAQLIAGCAGCQLAQTELYLALCLAARDEARFTWPRDLGPASNRPLESLQWPQRARAPLECGQAPLGRVHRRERQGFWLSLIFLLARSLGSISAISKRPLPAPAIGIKLETEVMDTDNARPSGRRAPRAA